MVFARLSKAARLFRNGGSVPLSVAAVAERRNMARSRF